MKTIPATQLTRITRTIAIAVLLFLAASKATGQSQIPPLFRVRKVTVQVSSRGDGSTALVSEGRLQTLVELRLRTAGLRVLSQEEDRNDPDTNPHISLDVVSIQAETEAGTITGYAYRLDLGAELIAPVSFNGSLAPVELWSDGTLAIAPRDAASAGIERIAGNLVDSFLNAWLTANPK